MPQYSDKGGAVDEAKMKELQANLEAEKKKMSRDFEKEKAKIAAKQEIAEEERARILQELEEKNKVQ
jgi:hypothetical protein